MKPYFQLILALFCSYSFCLISQELDTKDLPFDHAAPFADIMSKKAHHNENEHQDFDHNPLEWTLSAECEPLTTVAGCVNVFSAFFSNRKRFEKQYH
jgi:hypothetical protein